MSLKSNAMEKGAVAARGPQGEAAPAAAAAAAHGAAAGGGSASHYRLIVLLSLMFGTALEWYDFSIVAQLDAPLTAAFFPPHASAEVKALSFWMVYALAFMVRPVGALVFGTMGDVCGRKVSLVATLLLMGASTTLIGCLPTYEHVGPAAPALLAVLRLMMGLSMGAEYTTAVIYVHEAAPPRLRALHAGLIAAACAVGSIIGLALIMTVQSTVSKSAMLVWGWRVPFLAAIPIVITAVMLRIHMQETDEFLRTRGAHSATASADEEEAAALPVNGHPHADGATIGSSAPQPASPKDATAWKAAAAAPSGGESACGWLRVDAARHVPVADLLRQTPLAFFLDILVVAFISSVLYVVYAWIPSDLRKSGTVPPLTSFGLVFTSLFTEFAGIVLGGWAAGHEGMPSLTSVAITSPLLAAFILGTLAVLRTRSLPGIWVMQNLALAGGGLLLGIHAAAFVHIYAPEARSTGFSLAYNIGCAVGGSAPAIVTALGLALANTPGAAGLAPGIWLSCLAVLAALAAVLLLRVAPQVNHCGRIAA